MNMSELALIQLRQSIFRRAVQQDQSDIPTIRLLSQAAVDDRAKCVLLRTLYDTRVVLYEDGRLLLNNSVWEYIRNGLRFKSPAVYAMMSPERWKPVYLGTTPTIETQWHRTRLTGNRLYPEAIGTDLVPAVYKDVKDEDVFSWLNFAHRNYLGADIPGGVLLAVPSITVEVSPGNVALGELQHISGVPPITYQPAPGNELTWVTLSTNGQVTPRPPADTPENEYGYYVRVRDAAGSDIEIPITIKVVSP